jgi:4Fe-4S ferredoxin
MNESVRTSSRRKDPSTCAPEAGRVVPVIDRGRCEGKSDCVEVCPFHVFEVRTMDPADFAALGFFAKLKSRAHGKQTAYTPHADQCHACNACVDACPEKAIRLVKRT